MAKRLKETGWTIVNDGFGFYTGWTLTRRDAIRDHVWWLHNYILEDDVKKAWAQCRRNGDRAVKVEIRALRAAKGKGIWARTAK